MSEQDHRLGDAWRAASRDEPSATLDDAIRAAARREVGAGPRRSRAFAWMPLAAAATIAALAIGIVEMMPHEDVALGVSSETMPAASALQKPATPPASDATAAAAPGAPSSNMAPLSRNAMTAADAERHELATKQKAQAPASSPTAPAPPQAFPASPRADVPPQARSEAATPPQQPAAAAQLQVPKPERRSLDAESRRGIVDVPRESADARSAAGDQPSARTTAPALAASPAPRTPAPASPSSLSSPAAPSVSGELRGDAAESARKTSSLAARDGATADQADATKSNDITARVKDAPARPADEWIRLIQRLRYEGKIAEAAKELAAFRTAYKDRADALLPRDLRDAKP